MRNRNEGARAWPLDGDARFRPVPDDPARAPPPCVANRAQHRARGHRADRRDLAGALYHQGPLPARALRTIRRRPDASRSADRRRLPALFRAVQDQVRRRADDDRQPRLGQPPLSVRRGADRHADRATVAPVGQAPALLARSRRRQGRPRMEAGPQHQHLDIQRQEGRQAARFPAHRCRQRARHDRALRRPAHAGDGRPRHRRHPVDRCAHRQVGRRHRHRPYPHRALHADRAAAHPRCDGEPRPEPARRADACGGERHRRRGHLALARRDRGRAAVGRRARAQHGRSARHHRRRHPQHAHLSRPRPNGEGRRGLSLHPPYRGGGRDGPCRHAHRDDGRAAPPRLHARDQAPRHHRCRALHRLQSRYRRNQGRGGSGGGGRRGKRPAAA